MRNKKSLLANGKNKKLFRIDAYKFIFFPPKIMIVHSITSPCPWAPFLEAIKIVLDKRPSLWFNVVVLCWK